MSSRRAGSPAADHPAPAAAAGPSANLSSAPPPAALSLPCGVFLLAVCGSIPIPATGGLDSDSSPSTTVATAPAEVLRSDGVRPSSSSDEADSRERPSNIAGCGRRDNFGWTETLIKPMLVGSPLDEAFGCSDEVPDQPRHRVGPTTPKPFSWLRSIRPKARSPTCSMAVNRLRHRVCSTAHAIGSTLPGEAPVKATCSLTRPVAFTVPHERPSLLARDKGSPGSKHPGRARLIRWIIFPERFAGQP